MNQIIFIWVLLFISVNSLFAQIKLSETKIVHCLPFLAIFKETTKEDKPSQVMGQTYISERHIYTDKRDEFQFAFAEEGVDCWIKWYAEDSVFFHGVKSIVNCVIGDQKDFVCWIDSIQSSIISLRGKMIPSVTWWSKDLGVSIIIDIEFRKLFARIGSLDHPVY